MERELKFVFVVICILYLNYVKCVSVSNLNKNEKSKLIGMIEIINHGASTPVYYYDEVKDVFKPDPKGILTARGAKQMKILGDYIRNKYFSIRNNFSLDKNGNYLAMSLGLPRCINSAISHLQAIFPNNLVAFRTFQMNNEENSLLIKKSTLGNYFDSKEFINKTDDNNVKDLFINFMNGQDDKLLSPRKCFRLNNTLNLEGEFNDEDKKIIIKNLNITFPYLINDLINSNFDTNIVTNIFDMLISLNYHYPDTVKYGNDLIKILAKYKIKHHYDYLIDEEDIKLLSSNLFDLFVTTFENLVDYEEGNIRKIRNDKRNNYNSLFIFGDERNFIDIFNNLIDKDYIRSLINEDLENNLNVYQELLPPYASHLIFELFYIDENFYVKIFYNGEEIFLNQKKIKKLIDRNISYDQNNGMKFEDFKSLLISRINEKYRTIECKN